MTVQKRPFRVVVTRPRPQGELFCCVLEAQGYEAVYLPLLEIKALANQAILKQQIAGLAEYQWAIFVSRSAVTMSQDLLQQAFPQWPTTVGLAAVGAGTAEALSEAGFGEALMPPDDWHSEGLLALPAFKALKGQKIALFCGVGGRPLLAETLSARGAEVARFISYERQCPQLDLKPWLALIQQQQLDAIVLTSEQSLLHLKQLFAETVWEPLKKIALVLVSERIMIRAQELGFEHCVQAASMRTEAILQALARLRAD